MSDFDGSVFGIELPTPDEVEDCRRVLAGVCVRLDGTADDLQRVLELLGMGPEAGTPHPRWGDCRVCGHAARVRHGRFTNHPYSPGRLCGGSGRPTTNSREG